MGLSYETINERPYSCVHPLSDELKLHADKNYLFDLAYLGGIEVRGEKSADFLQGQLSCDVMRVDATKTRQGIYCNVKGRILALLDLIFWNNLFHLILPQDLIEKTIHSLNKTAFLSRVALNATPLQCFGFSLQSKDDLLPPYFNLQSPEESVFFNEKIFAYRLNPQDYLIISHLEESAFIKKTFEEHQQMRGSLAWHARQLQKGRIEIYPRSRALFLPHRLDLHLRNYIDFDKGCYKGQEIIARTHYLATGKYSLFIKTIQHPQKPSAGLPILSRATQKAIGELIDFCPIASDQYLIAASLEKNFSGSIDLGL